MLSISSGMRLIHVVFKLALVTFVINLIWEEIDSRCVQSGYVAKMLSISSGMRLIHVV
jgi:hypothetical protein